MRSDTRSAYVQWLYTGMANASKEGASEGAGGVNNLIAKIVTGTAAVVLLGTSGCGGDSGSGTTMSLSVGDTPVDGAEK
jgi:hypothetical protein